MSNFLRRILNRVSPKSLEASAVSSTVLAPNETRTSSSSIYLPGEFDAVISCVNNDRAAEWIRLSGDPQFHLPTIRYELFNARISGDALFSGRYFQRFHSKHPINGVASGVVKIMSEAVLSTNHLSSLEFGHWYRDSLVSEIYGVNEGHPSVALAREPWTHEPAFRNMVNLQCEHPSECKIAKLIILDDRGHTKHWNDRFLQLRERARSAAVRLDGVSAGPLVLLRRGTGARDREPYNIDEIQMVLEGLSFQTIDPSSLSVEDIATALRDAKMVVGTEGSNLNHVHFFAPNGVLMVALQDPSRFSAWHKGFVDLYDGKFGFIVGRRQSATEIRHSINVDDLRRTIDLMRLSQ